MSKGLQLRNSTHDQFTSTIPMYYIITALINLLNSNSVNRLTKQDILLSLSQLPTTERTKLTRVLVFSDSKYPTWYQVISFTNSSISPILKSASNLYRKTIVIDSRRQTELIRFLQED